MGFLLLLGLAVFGFCALLLHLFPVEKIDREQRCARYETRQNEQPGMQDAAANRDELAAWLAEQ